MVIQQSLLLPMVKLILQFKPEGRSWLIKGGLKKKSG
jgi:hypothetical protein